MIYHIHGFLKGQLSKDANCPPPLPLQKKKKEKEKKQVLKQPPRQTTERAEVQGKCSLSHSAPPSWVQQLTTRGSLNAGGSP